jgi:hypothetical protein
MDFVFSEAEQARLNSMSARRALRRAAELLYHTPKYGRRGEFGELLLHVVLRQYFNTSPAVRKIYFKDSPNDTVKGFDSVHVLAFDNDLELWLGEVKFYSNLTAAISDVVAELHSHSGTDYLRKEFSLILNKLDQDFPHYTRLVRLLDPATSLDEVFTRMRIPVLLTYDSATTARHTSLCDQYLRDISDELADAHAKFAAKNSPPELQINLILIPLATKSDLLAALHGKLEGMQR